MSCPAFALQNPDPSGESVFQSALFSPPGRPRPLARRLAIHNRTVGGIRSFLEDNRFQEIPVTGTGPAGPDLLDAMIERGFPAVWCEDLGHRPGPGDRRRHLRAFKVVHAAGEDLDLPALGDLLEALLKTVAAGLGADILGGRAVTRIDRMLGCDHPRLRHSEALAILNRRGWSLAPGAALDAEAQASLLRYCGDLPVLLTHRPGPAQAGPAGGSERLQYLLPYAGEVADGGVRTGDVPRAGFGLGVARLLQYLMGLGSIADTVIAPGARP